MEKKLIQGKKYDLKYTLKPKPIATKDISNISSDKLPNTIRLTDIKINGMLPQELSSFQKVIVI